MCVRCRTRNNTFRSGQPSCTSGHGTGADRSLAVSKARATIRREPTSDEPLRLRLARQHRRHVRRRQRASLQQLFVTIVNDRDEVAVPGIVRRAALESRVLVQRAVRQHAVVALARAPGVAVGADRGDVPLQTTRQRGRAPVRLQQRVRLDAQAAFEVGRVEHDEWPAALHLRVSTQPSDFADFHLPENLTHNLEPLRGAIATRHNPRSKRGCRSRSGYARRRPRCQGAISAW